MIFLFFIFFEWAARGGGGGAARLLNTDHHLRFVTVCGLRVVFIPTISYLHFSSKKPYVCGGFSGPKRKTWMNEWMNEWMSVRSHNDPQRLDEARASQIWVQHPSHPYTPVHNAASTDEAQTCWGRLQSYEGSDRTASCAAGVRLKKIRSSGFRCETGHSFIHSFTHLFTFSFWSAEASRNLGFLRGICSFSSDRRVIWTQVAPSWRSAKAFSDLLKLFRKGTDGVYLFSTHMQAMASIPSGYLTREWIPARSARTFREQIESLGSIPT